MSVEQNDHIPLSLSEDFIQPLYVRDTETGAKLPDEDLDALAEAVRRARGHAEQVIALSAALKADPTKTREAVALSLRENGLRAGEKAAEALDKVRDRLAASVARLTSQTALPPPSPNAGAIILEGEIRTALAGMRSEDRIAAISQAFEDRDDAVIGAVLRGPALLSGLTKEHRLMLQNRYRTERHPQETARIAQLSKALDGLDRGALALFAFTEAFTTSPQAIRAEQAAERTQQALAGFN